MNFHEEMNEPKNIHELAIVNVIVFRDFIYVILYIAHEGNLNTTLTVLDTNVFPLRFCLRFTYR